MGEFLSSPDKTKDSHDSENSYLRYGVCGMQGWRKRMEDAHITDISEGKDKNINVFGVFDGHGGKEISTYVSRHFTDELIKNKKLCESDNLKEALKETFIKMDEIMQTTEGINEIKEIARESKKQDDIISKKEPNNSQMQIISELIGAKDPESNDISMRTGCTACVCAIDQRSQQIYFANAGDSRVVICKKGVAYAMSIDHKPELETEKNRIYKADGWISDGRVKGNLNLTRGFGDLEYKQNKNLKPEEQIITADPDIVIENYNNNIDFIIIGCDGIWDCLTNQEACDFVKERLSKNPNIKLSSIIEEMMDNICATDIYNETGVGCDNMTCMIITFKK